MDQLTEQSNLDIYDEIINIKKEMMKNIFKEKYNLYRIDIKIDEIIDNIFNSDIDFKMDPKYEKEIPKMIREKGRLRPNRCIARKWNGGYGGQCTRYKLPGTEFCKKHNIEENRWCGLITEDRKTDIYPPLTPKEKLINFTKESHKWKN
jgi:hypothetical protein